jgi:membrane protein
MNFFRTAKKVLSPKEIFSVFVETINELIDDKGLKMSAALSYYTLLSLAPLMIIIIAIAGLLFGEDAARGEIVHQIEDAIGTDGAEVIEELVLSTYQSGSGVIATVISVAVMLIVSMGVFVELKESLNIIWGVEQRPGHMLKGVLFTRLSSFTMVIGTGLILLLSLIFNALLSGLFDLINQYYPEILPYLQFSNYFITFGVITLLFAMIFKFLPDVTIKWKYVWMGAIFTSCLFALGKYLISLYLGQSAYKTTFGVAGSLVLFIVWINYSSLIMYFGAEFTQVFRKHFSSHPLVPKKNAVIIPKVSQLVKDIAAKEIIKKDVKEDLAGEKSV